MKTIVSRIGLALSIVLLTYVVSFCFIPTGNWRFCFLVFVPFLLWVGICSFSKRGDQKFTLVMSASVLGIVSAEGINLFSSLRLWQSSSLIIVYLVAAVSLVLVFKNAPTPEDPTYHFQPTERQNLWLEIPAFILAGVVSFLLVYNKSFLHFLK